MVSGTVRNLERLALAAAVAVRAAGLWSIGQTRYAEHPLVDAWTFWAQARQILDGSDPFGEGFYQPPAYPVLLAGFAKLTGGLDLQATRALHLALGVLTAWLLVRLGRRLGEPHGAPWAGALAAVLFSLYPTTLLFELDILTPAVTSAAFVGALALLWQAGAPSWWRSLLAGLLLGLACAVHPTYLLAAGAMVGWLALRSWRRGALAVAGIALMLAPTTAVNLTRWDHFALVSDNAGINFYLGNNPGWRDTALLRPGLPFRKLALEADPATRDLLARNRYWRDRTWGEIAEHPDAWGAALLTKAFWSVHDREIPRNEDYRCRTRAGPMAWLGWLPVRWGWVFPLAVAGAGLCARRGWPDRLVPLGWLGLQLPLVIFMVADRYRLATWPLVCLAAGPGLAAGVAMVRGLRAGRRPSPGWALVAVAAVLPWLPIDRRTDFDEAWCVHVDANLAVEAGEPEEAAKLYEQAVALDPDDIGAWSFLAEVRYEAGDTRGAAAAMEHVLADFPDHYPSLMLMGRIQYKLGNRSEAADLTGRAYRVPGERTSTGVRYVKLLVRAGRIDDARAVVAADPKLRGHPDLEGVIPDD